MRKMRNSMWAYEPKFAARNFEGAISLPSDPNIDSEPGISAINAEGDYRCPNCGEKVIQNFCPNCGQEKTDKILPASHLLHDAFDEFFKLDSKFGKTLVPLVSKPGFLTAEYLAGRRVRYVSPFRFYFIVSAIYFICFSFSHYDSTVMRGLAIGIEKVHHAHYMAATNHTGTIQHSDHMHEDMITSNPDEMSPAPAHSRESRHFAAVNRTSAWYIKNQSIITFLLVPFAALLMKLLYYGVATLHRTPWCLPSIFSRFCLSYCSPHCFRTHASLLILLRSLSLRCTCMWQCDVYTNSIQ